MMIMLRYDTMLSDSVRIKRFYGKINHFGDNDTQVNSTDQINIFIHPLTFVDNCCPIIIIENVRNKMI